LRRAVVPIALAAALAAPAAASAAVFGGEVLDGPGAALRLGGLDLARDGSGAVAYVRDGSVFVARFVGGAFAAPEPFGGGAEADVAASDGGRLVAVWTSGGTVFGAVRPAADQPWAAPVALGTGEAPAVEMSTRGTAYAAWASGGDVRLARIDRRAGTWAAVEQPADADPAATAGAGAGRPAIAVAADGVALVTWGERGADGRTHVWARKAFGTRVSSFPQDLTLASLDGVPAGSADTPSVDAEDDSSFAWVAFRQDVGAGSRVVARRQRGTGFEAPVAADGGAGGSAPAVDLAGRGAGQIGSVSAAGLPQAAPIQRDAVQAVQPLGAPGLGAAAVAPAVAENGDALLAWAQGGGATVRVLDEERSLGDTAVGSPQLGAVDAPSLAAASDRAGSQVVAWVQQGADGRRLVTAVHDRPPLAPGLFTTTRWRDHARAPLRWGPAFDLFGGATYRVEVDGQAVGETTSTRLNLPAPLPDGVHRWRVVAVDRRGQQTASRTRTLRVDATPPRLQATIRRRGGVVEVRARAVEARSARSSGLQRIRVELGRGRVVELERSGTVRRAVGRGRLAIRVSATDRAGNAAVVRRTLR
jgi:hypothetical protein